MFDINTAIGHWPFRKLPITSAAGLIERLNALGIDGAAVVNTHGLFYKNCQDANLELADELAPYRERLVGIATLNPHYPAWERDLRVCVSELGLRGVRLAPQYHDYKLGDSESLALVHAAGTLGVPVFIPSRVVDVRQCHWMDTERTVGLSEVTALCAAVPDARIVFTEFPATAGQLCDASDRPLRPNLYVELSRMRSSYGQVLAEP
jgi:predicted TIM-barrel fold metal-dependent hydrolase